MTSSQVESVLKGSLRDVAVNGSLANENFIDETLCNDFPLEVSAPESPNKQEKNEEKEDRKEEDQFLPASFTKRRFLLDCVFPRILFPREEEQQLQLEEEDLPDRLSPNVVLKQMFEYDNRMAMKRRPSKQSKQQPYNSDSESSSDLESVPRRFMRPRMCKLCNMVFTSDSQANIHYQGKTHFKKERHYIENKLLEHEKAIAHKTGLRSGANAIVRRIKTSSDDEELPNPWQCILCNIRLNSALAARAHYSGRSHRRKEEKYSEYRPSRDSGDLRDRLNRERREGENENRERKCDERKYRHKNSHHHHHHRRHSHSS